MEIGGPEREEEEVEANREEAEANREEEADRREEEANRKEEADRREEEAAANLGAAANREAVPQAASSFAARHPSLPITLPLKPIPDG